MLSSIVSAQSWTSEEEDKLELTGIQDFYPTKYKVAKVSDVDIKSILWSAPYEDESIAIDSPARLRLMMADGTTMTFGMVRYDMQEPLLAAKFDDIRTFKGRSLSDQRIRVRLDYTVHGLRAVINAPGQHVYIEHYKRGNKDYKIIYDRKDFPAPEAFTCGVTNEKIEDIVDSQMANVRQGNCELNLLQLANAANIEYSAFHISDPSIPDLDEVHSAVVTAVNRVNEVYEQDFGVRMVLVNNNENLYYTSGTDPYTNGNGGTMLGQNQTNVDNVIGSANYDIGHVFSTGGGGVAYLSSVCNNSQKAGGVTGQGSPIGDPFSIDYVAHEMGHQMGANHTQNNSCNRNGGTAMEPGSASTIMGYAGICSPNVQNNSDPYFHAISVQEVMNDASVFSCAEEVTNFGNTSPAVSIAATTYNIPKSTTFVLDANGTDADGDDLTYCWEQMDNDVATMPPASTNTGGPAFRSLEPVADSKRYFPSLPDIIAGNSPTWEVLPSVTRNMDFRVTVRDWHDGPGTSDAGCTAEADLVVSVDGNSGPFVVTSQASNVTWDAGDSKTITWDVANTNVAPVSCSNVEIWFSEDDTFGSPTLLTTTANNGSASILAPAIITTTGRVMVKGENNIFFDINEGEITIEQSNPTFEMLLTSTAHSYCNDVNTTQTRILTNSILGYNTSINLSIASGLPAGATAAFSNNPIAPGDFSFLDISGFAGEEGDYDIVINGQSGAILKTVVYQLSLAGAAIAPLAVSPIDGAANVSNQPTLMWEDLFATSYDYEISTAPNGIGVIQSGNVTGNEIAVASILAEASTYYWRVKTNNGCGTSEWSNDYTFSTVLCQTYSSNDIPMTISSVGSNVIVTSDLTIYDRGIISDLNVVSLSGTHTYVSDLNFSLTSPDNTKMEFWDQPCNNQNNFDINFDDEAANGDFPCPPNDGLTYKPDTPLTFFDTKEMLGEWQLEIIDDANQDGGELQNWGLKVCAEDFCDLTVSNNGVIGYGSFMGAVNCAVSGDTIRLMTDIANQTISLTQLITIDKDLNFLADPADNIILSFNNSIGGLDIGSGNSVSIEGFTIQSSGSIPTLSNNGSLKLIDVNVLNPVNNQVINGSTGTMEIEGACNIQK